MKIGLKVKTMIPIGIPIAIGIPEVTGIPVEPIGTVIGKRNC